MTPTYIVAVELAPAMAGLNALDPAIERAAVRAVNKIATQGRTIAAREIRRQVAMPARYLAPSGGRLNVVKSARRGDVEAIIRGRERPTSLARFTNERPLAKGQSTGRRTKGVKVTVKPGVARYITKAFVIPLRSGSDGELGNIGLAVRSDNAPPGAYKPKKIGSNLWLLYGPSVSQMLYSARNAGGVADDIAPDLTIKLETEFRRLVKLDLP